MPRERSAGLVADYEIGRFFDEMFDESGRPRDHYRALGDRLAALTDDGLRERIHTANAFFLTQGIGFTVYGDDAGTDRIFPFDLIPRIVPAAEWEHVERGLAQRVHALNLFLADIYDPQRILDEGIVPVELVFGSRNFRREMIGVEPAGGIYAHVVRHRSDPRRTTAAISCSRTTCALRRASATCSRAARRSSGSSPRSSTARVSGRSTTTHASCSRRSARSRRAATGDADDRPAHARRVQLRVLRALLPRAPDGHRDRRGTRPRRPSQPRLQPQRPAACSGSTSIYRRIDDDFLDPLAFRPDSLLGVPGPAQRLPRRQRHARERHRHRRRRRQGDLPVRAGHDPLLPRRGARSCRNVPTYVVRPPDDLRGDPRADRGARRQGGRPVGRLRDADRPRRDAPRSARSSGAASSPSRATTSRSPRSRSRGTRRSCAASSTAATSTCDRSSSAGPTACASSPAA